MAYQTVKEVLADYEMLERDDQYRLLIDLGRKLEPMPDALKTEATKVRGCLSQVWTYPVPASDGQRLHFLADSNSQITKGVIALILMLVQDRTAHEVLALDIEGLLAPFDLGSHLSPNRANGIPNMIALIRETAGRLAA